MDRIYSKKRVGSLIMEIGVVRGGTKKNVLGRKFNIGVGISLGNKWFTTANIVKAAKWALKHTRENVVVYVADTIHAINLEVRNKISPERARRVAKRKGEAILREVRAELEKTVGSGDLDKIHFTTWEGLLTESYKQKLSWLYTFYEKNVNFREIIHCIVRNYVSDEPRAFTEAEIHKLGAYIIEELPEILCRVPADGRVFEANVYPFDGETVQFAEDLQNGLRFPEVKEAIIDTEPKVFVELR